MPGAIDIVGGGPAGSAAAIAARLEGAEVRIFERSLVPRHKVCGEFIPHEACATLAALGALPEFLRLKPAPIRRCILHWASTTKQWNLPEPGFSLSRLALDRLLLEHARILGARVIRGESLSPARTAARATVLACGRQSAAPRSQRLFGFKSHFTGPVADTVELHFTPHGYFGVSSVENGETNVCGIAPENLLARYGFDIDAFAASQPALAARLRPLSRNMPWLKVGPLVLSGAARDADGEHPVYRAGDALGFIDPFTGSGIWNALLTGRRAGAAAARRTPVESYLHSCRDLLGRPFAISTIFRTLLRLRLGSLATFLPGAWLYRLTRASHMGFPDA